MTLAQRRQAAEAKHSKRAAQRETDAKKRDELHEGEGYVAWPPPRPTQDRGLTDQEKLDEYYAKLGDDGQDSLLRRVVTCAACNERGCHCWPLSPAGFCPWCAQEKDEMGNVKPVKFTAENGLDLDLDPD